MTSQRPNENATELTPRRRELSADDKKFFKYLRVFLVPTLLLKIAVFYFGIHYSNEPGEGYGYGLIAALAFSAINFTLFVYKNWDDEDQ